MQFSRLFHYFIQLAQSVISAIILGVLAHEISILLSAHRSVPTGIIFALSLCIVAILTAALSAFSKRREVKLVYLSGFEVLIAFLFGAAFVWVLLQISPVACGWATFNPFGKNECGRMRAALTFMIVEVGLWLISAMYRCLTFDRKTNTEGKEFV
ncbi:hypothetical protein V1512DRAFT_20199 [Lipomyces arxii]|uniref:uncharacterized protein n=1 Tax=Lipomyces arxii TaxID=56418 RepID=UPI0034CEDA98